MTNCMCALLVSVIVAFAAPAAQAQTEFNPTTAIISGLWIAKRDELRQLPSLVEKLVAVQQFFAAHPHKFYNEGGAGRFEPNAHAECSDSAMAKRHMLRELGVDSTPVDAWNPQKKQLHRYLRVTLARGMFALDHNERGLTEMAQINKRYTSHNPRREVMVISERTKTYTASRKDKE